MRLGVLRMDVDNLGDIFSLGFGETGAADNLATLARLSTLSFQVSMYFEGWVKKLCEHYPDLIYAVYAGGDDLFLIGPWDIMPALAQDIQRDFYAYTGEHPTLHVSGGLAFIHGKYPIYQAAQDADDTLQQAKNLDGKNAFSFLGQAWPWTVFDGLIKKRDGLLHLVAHKKIDLESLEGPQAIIQILRKLAADEADEARRMKNRPVWGPWMWKGAYQLKRMAERMKVRTPELSTKVDQLREELAANDYSEINQWGVVARWTQLLTRKTFQGKEKKE